MTAVRRVLVACTTVAALGATAGCSAVSVGRSTLARAPDGTYVLLVEICDSQPPVVALLIDDLWEAAAPDDAGHSYSVVLSGLDLAGVPPDRELFVGGWTDEADHSLSGPDVTAGQVAALRAGELIVLTDEGDYGAFAMSESAWRADACRTS